MARVVACAFLLLSAAGARAQVRYLGPHPIDREGRWDYEEAEHTHADVLVGDAAFGVVDGLRVFLADPIAWGWDRDVWTYRGAHPLPGGLPGYCGIRGEHRHPFAPEGSYRRTSRGVYAYAGALHGGLPMVRPERLAPRHVIVRAPPVAPPSPVPYWFGGCPTRLVLEPSGAYHPEVAPGCAVRRPGRRRPPPRHEPTFFDGRYGTWVRPDRGVAPRPPPPRTQRR